MEYSVDKENGKIKANVPIISTPGTIIRILILGY